MKIKIPAALRRGGHIRPMQTEAGAILFGSVAALTPGPLFFYRYVIDNRLGASDVTEVSILVDSVHQNVSLMPSSHTEPTGWMFNVAESGGSASPPLKEFGTFWAWDNLTGLPAGAISPVFSFTTNRAPVLSDLNNFFLFSPALLSGPTEGIAAFGFTLAPDFGV
jgi:hypothetical protein